LRPELKIVEITNAQISLKTCFSENHNPNKFDTNFQAVVVVIIIIYL